VPNPRILIVDNQRTVRRTLRSGLDSLGEFFEILEATSGEEALLAFAEAPVDILITGVHLAGISGLELMQRLRKRQPALKVILTVANPDAHLSHQALQAHANALIPKPIDIDGFVEAVRRCLDMIEAKPRQGEQPDGSLDSLGKHLESKCQEMGAAATVLLDPGGEILGKAGEAAKMQMIVPLIPALLEALGASARLSQALDEPVPDDLLCFSGAKVDLFAAHIGQPYALLVVFDTASMGNTRPRAARLVSLAVQELAGLLPQPQATREPHKKLEKSPPLSKTREHKKDTADLKAALEQASGKHLDPQKIDAFWKEATEQHDGDSGHNPDAMSFDQAQDMGIIQDE
jgi:CheY-like chemotaxis protein